MPDYVTDAQVDATIPQWPRARWPAAMDADLEVSGIEGQINSALAARGITTPFVSSGSDAGDAFADTLTLIARNGVAWRIVRASFPSQTSGGADSAWHDYMTVYKTGLASIANGTGIPLAITEGEDKVAPATTGITHAATEVNESQGSEHQAHFTRKKADTY